MKPGIFAMEDLDPPASEEGTLAPVEIIDDGLADAISSGLELQQVHDGIHQAGEVVNTLTAIQDTAADIIDAGGMSEPVATALAVAVEAMLTRINYPVTKRSAVAMEGFKSKTLRMRSSALVMEDFKNTASKISKAIQSASVIPPCA